MQVTTALAQSSSTTWQGIAEPLPSILFTTTTSLNGFDAVFIHRVSVWSEVVVPGNGQTVWPTLQVHMADPTGQLLWPSFNDHAPGYNLRARVGFHVPAHLSGPYLANSTKRFMQVQAYGADQSGTFTVKTVTIEVEGTWC